MVIYGVALLALCTLVGVFTGDLIGQLIGIDKNVGGVGIAMLLLLLIASWRQVKLPLSEPARNGVVFWSAMYIPIVVAMAASQDVFHAIAGGWLALVAGAGAVIACIVLVPVLTRLAPK